jgi:hypothetical protein
MLELKCIYKLKFIYKLKKKKIKEINILHNNNNNRSEFGAKFIYFVISKPHISL